MTNLQLSKESWKSLKVDLQKEWDFITTDEWDRTKGSLKAIFGLIETKSGLHQEEVKSKLVKLLKKYTKIF